ncbi:MAG: hypothetical protein HKN09_05020 [Saprospiraceae bacterium]|nr:hypothetical protein [Saprospiraceae bacterium]
MCQRFNAHLYMVHVKTFGDSIFEYDPAMDIYLDGINYSYKALENESTVAVTLSNYCDYLGADALCMIHRQKTWFQRLFAKSITKEELFEINLPLLILNAHK